VKAATAVKTMKPGALLAGAVILGVVAVEAVAPAQPQGLDRLLDRAGDYVVKYGDALSNVLAEESYTQRLVQRGNGRVLQTRQLTSEIAFVRLPDTSEWVSFRNVVAVDDVPVLEANGRLERVFQDSSPDRLSRARALAGESARYNLGPITREINVPTLALHFLHPEHRSSSRFNREGEENVDGNTVWIVRFRERERGNLISRGDGRSLPAEGRLWIAPSDGRVVRSELVVKDFVREGGESKATVNVSWRRDVSLDMWVPQEMRELYEGPWRFQAQPNRAERYDIDGTATYSNYRRFTVDVRIK
jgi:hypothetical protein